MQSAYLSPSCELLSMVQLQLRVGAPQKLTSVWWSGAAIMMQSNAWRALQELGVADELRATHMEIDRCCLPPLQGFSASCT